MKAIHRENSLKYSFLDLSPLNNDLRVGGTWFQCFCYHESRDISKHTGTVQKLSGTKTYVDTRVIQYLYVLRTHFDIENTNQYIHLKTRSLLEWNLLTDTVFASCVSGVVKLRLYFVCLSPRLFPAASRTTHNNVITFIKKEKRRLYLRNVTWVAFRPEYIQNHAHTTCQEFQAQSCSNAPRNWTWIKWKPSLSFSVAEEKKIRPYPTMT
jgi:hypothetical protein